MKNLDKKITFEGYEVDKELNKTIQVEIFERGEEKREYMDSSRRKLGVENICEFNTEKAS